MTEVQQNILREEPWINLQQQMISIGCEPGLGPVFGNGNPRAALALVGEAPGEREVWEGRPFVGQAGQLLDHLLASADLKRDDL